MLCVAASWPSTHPADRSTAPARGVRRWMPSCCCATFETAYRCQRWQSSGRLNPAPNEAKMQSSGDVTNVLKKLDALDDLRLICGSCDERVEAETQLSTEVSLQPWVEDALVNLHARKKVPMNSNFTPWTIEEDRLLLHTYQSGAKINEIRVGVRSYKSIKHQLRRLQNVTLPVRDAHHKSRCDPEAPFQYLQHDIWTPIDSTLALPPCAQIDWIRGVAKVPPLPCSPARARDHSAISND
mmetsp:Transcript_23025/g.77696  ORF Transcript_23025/g.77696 Transcript_23025/m.77696 type:complete len:240 (+) Transcript_23025:145-864(+)